jgi:hypothetical protein
MTIEAIENAIFAQLYPDRLKVAMLVAKAFWRAAEEPSVDDINTALKQLSARSDVECFGNILNWRYSEMRRVDP